MLSHTKYQDVVTLICRFSSDEGLPILATHAYKNNWQNLLKTFASQSKNSARKKKRKKEWQRKRSEKIKCAKTANKYAIN